MTFWAGAQILLLAVMAAVIARLTLSLWPGFGKAKTVTPAQAAADATQVLLWCETTDGQVIWANAAYAEMARKTGSSDGLIRLFSRYSSGGTRHSVNVDGQTLWFDVDERCDAQWRIGLATPVDAVVQLERALAEMVQTMAKTFAQLPTGLAVFDHDRHLQLFNPALCELSGLSPAFLSRRPSLTAVLDAMRDRNTVPEPKNWKDWRGKLADMERAAHSGQSMETWALPGGQTYRVIARPHPNGALALLIDDISSEITRNRRHRADLELGQSVIDSMDEAIAVFAGSGQLVMSNTAYTAFWGYDPAALVGDIGIRQLAEQWREASAPSAVWTRAEEFVTLGEDRAPWQAEVRLADGRLVGCRISPLSGGATMVAFQRAAPQPIRQTVASVKGQVRI